MEKDAGLLEEAAEKIEITLKKQLNIERMGFFRVSWRKKGA